MQVCFFKFFKRSTVKYNSETIYDLTAFEETTVGISPTIPPLKVFFVFSVFTDAMRYLRDRLFH